MSVVDRNTQFRVLEKIQKLSQEWGCEMFNKKLTSISLIFLTLLLGSANTTAQSYTFYHPDANGSPVAATDANGDVLWRENYSPYGEKLIDDMAAIDNSRGFTSHVFDEETGLIYAGARYYDPVVGRFMGVDPAGFDPGNIHSFNQYAYANNNPYRYSDPDGRIPLETVWDIANVGMGVVSLSVNLWNGNYSAAAVDAGGLLLDVGATLIPYVPGGASAAIRAERLGEVGYTVAKSGVKALPPAKVMDHHLMPRQFKKFFESRGIDIDQHTVTLGEKTHLKGVHGNGLGDMPGGWNKKWQQFIDDNPNASAKDVYQQLGKMMDEFGLSNSRIHPYKQ